jgi:hypothetical protein
LASRDDVDLGRRSVALVLAASSGCVTGVGRGYAVGDGRVAAHAPPAAWRRIAVLPLGGPPQHRRPCEELLALRLAEQTSFVIVPPFAVRRAVVRGVGPDGAAPPWAALALDPADRPAPAPADVRELARALGVDAIVAGAIASGASAPTERASAADPAVAPLAPSVLGEPVGLLGIPGVDLVLVDGSTGDVVAVERWRESAGWIGSRRDPALHATACAGADLLAILRTPPGEAPGRPAPDSGCGGAPPTAPRGTD